MVTTVESAAIKVMFKAIGEDFDYPAICVL
jgi:hypothetical protein